MVAGIYFLREMLLFTFTKILLGVRSKVLLSLMFSFTAAFLSAFLDALTVTAVIITVAAGSYGVYHKVASGKKFDHDHDPTTDDQVVELHRDDLEQFPRIPAQPDDARRRRHGAGRRDHAGGRAAEPADRRGHGLGVCRVLPAHGAYLDAGACRRPDDLCRAGADRDVRLRRAAVAQGARGARGVRQRHECEAHASREGRHLRCRRLSRLF